jgi:retinol dehydrogenase-13
MSRKDIKWISEETRSKNLTGKVYIVTGANSGVGLETTRQLIKQGGHVVMACRRVDAAQKEADTFKGLIGSYDIIRLDLADLSSVREFVKNFKAKYDRLDGLDGNAGMVNMNQKIITKDGIELTQQVSFYGHFLLTELLLDVLKNTEDSRVVILSSVVHAGSKRNRHDLHLDDINFENRKYSNFAVYGEAKLQNVLYAKELAKRLEKDDISVFSVHPGWARSNFGSGGKGLMGFVMGFANILMKPFMPFISESNEEAAQTSLHCLISDEAVKHSGEYFSQRSVLYSDKECRPGGWPMESPNPNAKDMSKAIALIKDARIRVGL